MPAINPDYRDAILAGVKADWMEYVEKDPSPRRFVQGEQFSRPQRQVPTRAYQTNDRVLQNLTLTSINDKKYGVNWVLDDDGHKKMLLTIGIMVEAVYNSWAKYRGTNRKTFATEFNHIYAGTYVQDLIFISERIDQHHLDLRSPITVIGPVMEGGITLEEAEKRNRSTIEKFQAAEKARLAEQAKAIKKLNKQAAADERRKADKERREAAEDSERDDEDNSGEESTPGNGEDDVEYSGVLKGKRKETSEAIDLTESSEGLAAPEIAAKEKAIEPTTNPIARTIVEGPSAATELAEPVNLLLRGHSEPPRLFKYHSNKRSLSAIEESPELVIPAKTRLSAFQRAHLRADVLRQASVTNQALAETMKMMVQASGVLETNQTMQTVAETAGALAKFAMGTEEMDKSE